MSSGPPQTPTPRTSASSSKRGATTRLQPQSLLQLAYRPHPGQQLFHERPERFRIIAAGARWGKDTATLMELLQLATSAAKAPNRSAMLIPRVHAWVVGPSFPLLQEPWRVLKRVIPPSLIVTTNETTKTIELAGDILIEFRSAERPETLVGSGLDVLCLLEAALIPEEAWTVSLRPRLASPGRWGLVIASGTPKGRGNWFHRLFLDGQNPERADVWSMHAATWDNPMVDPAEIESMRDTMTARAFAQEIAAEFVTDDGAVFRGVRECILPARSARGAVVVGVDWALRRDRTALCAVDETAHVTAFEAFRPFGAAQAITRTVAFIKAVGARRVVGEQNSIGDPLNEALEDALAGSGIIVEHFTTTAASKRQAIDRLALAIEQREVSFPDIPVLINELTLFEFTTSAAGATRFSAPSGAHDDAVMALALALHGVPRRSSSDDAPFGWTSNCGMSLSGYHRVGWSSQAIVEDF